VAGAADDLGGTTRAGEPLHDGPRDAVPVPVDEGGVEADTVVPDLDDDPVVVRGDGHGGLVDARVPDDVGQGLADAAGERRGVGGVDGERAGGVPVHGEGHDPGEASQSCDEVDIAGEGRAVPVDRGEVGGGLGGEPLRALTDDPGPDHEQCGGRRVVQRGEVLALVRPPRLRDRRVPPDLLTLGDDPVRVPRPLPHEEVERAGQPRLDDGPHLYGKDGEPAGRVGDGGAREEGGHDGEGRGRVRGEPQLPRVPDDGDPDDRDHPGAAVRRSGGDGPQLRQADGGQDRDVEGHEQAAAPREPVGEPHGPGVEQDHDDDADQRLGRGLDGEGDRPRDGGDDTAQTERVPDSGAQEFTLGVAHAHAVHAPPPCRMDCVIGMLPSDTIFRARRSSGISADGRPRSEGPRHRIPA
jgi:hypothetical protein